jgi:hypothetical protein
MRIPGYFSKSKRRSKKTVWETRPPCTVDLCAFNSARAVGLGVLHVREYPYGNHKFRHRTPWTVTAVQTPG